MKVFTFLIFWMFLFSMMLFSEMNTNKEGVQKNIAAFSLGYSFDLNDRQGYNFVFNFENFFGATPFYFAFRNITSFFNHDLMYIDYGLVLGYNSKLIIPQIGIDFFIGPVMGNQYNTSSKIFNEEALGIQTGLGVALFYDNDTDIQVIFSPIIRPFNSKNKSWDFKSSYFSISLQVNFKSLQHVKPGYWIDEVQE